MNILQVIATLDSAAGGTVEAMIQQGQALAAAGHQVNYLSLDAPGSVIDGRLSADKVSFVGPSRWTYGYAPRLGNWLQQYAPTYDVLVVHGLWQFHGLAVAQIARKKRLPYVVFAHGMLDPWFKHRYPAKHLKKWLYWPWGEYRVLRDARFVLFTTEEEQLLARQSFPLYAARERMVGFGIKNRDITTEGARAAFLDAFPHLRNTRNLLFLSRIHPKKGCDLLLEAFAKVANLDGAVHLVLAGPDATGEEARLRVRAHELGIDSRVTFTGMLRGLIKWGAYDAAEVFVLPSHQENFGIVLAEALASAVPVLTTFKVNIWREIKACGAGMIQEDKQDGVDALLRGWITLSADERAAMRSRALACFQAHFELTATTARLIKALDEAISGKPASYTHRGSWGFPASE